VQEQTLGHRDRKDDPLYDIQRPLTISAERLDPSLRPQPARAAGGGDPTTTGTPPQNGRTGSAENAAATRILEIRFSTKAAPNGCHAGWRNAKVDS
jgi:hypothetical protein